MFSIHVIHLVETLPQKRSAWVIADQLLRSATSIGANMIEGKGSSSRLELKKYNEIALKSANETKYWLELLRDVKFVSDAAIQPSLTELQELTNMIASGIMKLKRTLWIFRWSYQLSVLNYKLFFVQQFVIPQFIDNEDHVIGPITTRQFLIMLAAGFLVFVTYKLLYFNYFLALSAVWLIMGVTLAFGRPNGRPFHFFLLNLIQTFRRPALRVWKKRATHEELLQDMKGGKEDRVVAPVVVRRRSMAVSRLSELSLVVDTGGVYKGEQ